MVGCLHLIVKRILIALALFFKELCDVTVTCMHEDTIIFFSSRADIAKCAYIQLLRRTSFDCMEYHLTIDSKVKHD